MTFAGVNYLAILIATSAGFAFGAAYCMSPSKPWLAAIGKTKDEIAQGLAGNYRWHPLAGRARYPGRHRRRDGCMN